MPTIILKSSEGKQFPVDDQIVRCSSMITNLLADTKKVENEEDYIPLPNVDSETLEKIIIWATHHKDDAKPKEDLDEFSEPLWVEMSEWDANFIKVHPKLLGNLTRAANFLDIKGLLDISCKAIANMVKGKTAEQIRQQFNIRNDIYTAGEEAHVLKEIKWCMQP